MAGHIERAEVDAGDADRVAAAHQVLRVVRGRLEAAQVVGVATGHPHLDAGGGRQVTDGSDVVEVPMRDQDRDQGEAALGQHVGDATGLVAGVDDHGIGRALGGHHEAVGLVGAEGEADDLERHPCCRFNQRLYMNASIR